MSVQIGSQLGPYRILSSLGSGGMGEVYLARDTKLGRDVALKVLASAIAAAPARIARFSREAQLLAALNHSNIAVIHGVEESGGQLALVLEYVDGETLAERIKRGPISLKEALRVCLQIAEALEAAHDKAVIHRDLKPANVKVSSQGVVKVLDFGLAKALEDGGTSFQDSSETPTVSVGSGEFILGTPGYMSPEQARGQLSDRRTDVWAFGVVLFEMLSGQRLFLGETVTDTLARTLERDPDWKKLPSTTPQPVRKLLQWCLRKDPKDRLQSIGDARILLQEWIADPPSLENEKAPAASPIWKRLLPWAVAPLFLILGFLVRRPAVLPESVVSQLEYTLPAGQSLTHYFRHGVDLSPDGKRFLFITTGKDGLRRISVRDLDRWDAVEIPGTEGAQGACFSPDGQSVAFFAGGKIKKVAVVGGKIDELVREVNPAGAQDFGPQGISWGKGGTIVYSRIMDAGLRTIRDNGADLQEFTVLDEKASEVSHRLPHFLPDGSAVLFTVLRGSTVTPNWKRAQIWLKSLKTGEIKWLLDDATDARYAGDGALVFARQGNLFAVPFDADALSVGGTPVPVLDGVIHSQYGINAVAWTGAAQFSVSESGSLLYAPGSIEPAFLSDLTWVDRTGKGTPLAGAPARSRFAARIAPGDGRIFFSELHVEKDIRAFDPLRGIEDRITNEGQNAFPIMTPTGSMLAFRSDRSGPLRIYLSREPNLRDAVPLTDGPLDTPSSFTPDGKELAFTRTGKSVDVFVVSTSEPYTVRPLLNTAAGERFPEFSPDGKWLAYCSNDNDSGRYELYIQPYPGPGKRITVTSTGAEEPAWSKNSNEIFYRNGRTMMSVSYEISGTELITKKPEVLFPVEGFQGGGATVRTVFDVSRDGRFLMIKSVPEVTEERIRTVFPSTLRFIFNWNDAVRKLISNTP